MASFIKNIIVFGGLAALAGIGYFLFVIEKEATLSNSDGASDAVIETQIFIKRLSELQTMDLSSDLFSDNRFLSLVDFSTIATPVPVGRDLPFEITDEPSELRGEPAFTQ